MWSSKGIALGQQKALSPESIAAIRKYLETNGSARDRALFALALDTMLRGCDLLKLRVADVCQCDGTVRDAFAVVQGKVSAGQARPVEVYVTGVTRDLVAALITAERKAPEDFLFTGKGRTRRLSQDMLRILVKSWCAAIGLNPDDHANHTLRRTKASALYARTKDVELVRQALGHAYVSSTQAYLAVGADQVRRACLSLSL